MAIDPRISDNELAAINAAAVTKEYRVQPHIGEAPSWNVLVFEYSIQLILKTIERYPLSMGKCYRITFSSMLNTRQSGP